MKMNILNSSFKSVFLDFIPKVVVPCEKFKQRASSQKLFEILKPNHADMTLMWAYTKLVIVVQILNPRWPPPQNKINITH
jgi:hypothetical protein